MTNLRCLIRGHRWEPIQSDNYGAFHRCHYCGKSKRVGSGGPPDAHDHLDVHG
jgi:hypothetical protein